MERKHSPDLREQLEDLSCKIYGKVSDNVCCGINDQSANITGAFQHHCLLNFCNLVPELSPPNFKGKRPGNEVETFGGSHR